ncbi:MAG: class I tRNA ligase family protein, partial [Candidatus Latescibacteria bacterium]|nr:class I tRNA ligase family protein [Candidatus Latescibacterota bacterium]
IEFMGDIPFSKVYIHGTVRDDIGRKMSKSLGNGVDPLEVIQSHGADALRFSIMVITAQGQDVFISYPRPGEKAKNDFNTFDIGRNFCNKIWNATRLILSNVAEDIAPGSVTAGSADGELADRWIVSRFNHITKEVTESLDSFRFNDASHTIYDFIWHDLCDWYLEMIKPRIAKGGREKAFVLKNAAGILAGAMQLLHPIMPFITEEIWQRLTDVLGSKSAPSIMVSSWPEADDSLIDYSLEKRMETLKSLISTIRTTRNEMNVPIGKKADVVVIPADDEANSVFLDNRSYILGLASVNNLTVDMNAKRPPKSVAGISEKNEVYIILEGLIDFNLEQTRLQKEIERRTNFIKRTEAKLQNEGFLSKAPKEIIQQERSKLDNSREELKKLSAYIEALGE